MTDHSKGHREERQRRGNLDAWAKGGWEAGRTVVSFNQRDCRAALAMTGKEGLAMTGKEGLTMTGKEGLAMTDHSNCHCEERQRRGNLDAWANGGWAAGRTAVSFDQRDCRAALAMTGKEGLAMAGEEGASPRRPRRGVAPGCLGRGW